MNPSILLNNPELNGISNDKLQFLLEFANSNKGKNPKDMMPLFIAASASAKNKGLSFSETETNLILEIMKQSMSDEERNKVELIISMIKKNNTKS